MFFVQAVFIFPIGKSVNKLETRMNEEFNEKKKMNKGKNNFENTSKWNKLKILMNTIKIYLNIIIELKDHIYGIY